ncbi:MAG: MBL fold metallo-hydrolase [Oscillospiraceae bacterium]|nr:MBL fold metallo-hydrolase [Oscillospiraceae bacterium]
MKIAFYGATKTVTGSNFLLEAAGKKILIDCGLYQGKKSDIRENYEEFPYNVEEIDFVLLTHCHIDHSGKIPKLYVDGYNNPVIATKATCDLAELMLPDSGYIQQMETEWKNKKRRRAGKPERAPLYTAQDGIDSLKLFKPVDYGEILELDENISVRYNDAGHMLGSAIIEVWVKDVGVDDPVHPATHKKIVFTGDLGNNNMILLDAPTMIENADYVVMESTYGNRQHMKATNNAERFLNIVSETLEGGGNVIIPSFAVGRTQEILYEINKLRENKTDEEFLHNYEVLMHTPVYVDSPLATSATEVFNKNTDLFDEEVREKIKQGENPLDFPGLQFTRTAEESKVLNETNTPKIIISASGMCDAGRIKHHLKHNIWNPKSTILFVGYQANGTLGSRIVNGEEKVKIFGEEINVHARIEYIEGYSGHADQEWLLNFVYSFIHKPKHIFLVHGEPIGKEVLKDKILETTGIPVSIPEYGEKYELAEEVTVIEKIDPLCEVTGLRLETKSRLRTLRASSRRNDCNSKSRPSKRRNTRKRHSEDTRTY